MVTCGIQRWPRVLAVIAADLRCCRLGGCMKWGDCFGGLDGEHDRLGMVEDASEGDTDGRGGREQLPSSMEHLLQLPGSVAVCWSGAQGGHVQPFGRCEMQPMECG